jgi:hypothetical protein
MKKAGYAFEMALRDNGLELQFSLIENHVRFQLIPSVTQHKDNT